jgi:hypothetical protein
MGILFGLTAKHGWKTGEAFTNWPYPPVRRETHPALFPFLQWTYAIIGLVLSVTGCAEMLGLTP